MDTVGEGHKDRIQEYIRNQLQEDVVSEQMTIKEYRPVYGSADQKRQIKAPLGAAGERLRLAKLSAGL